MCLIEAAGFAQVVCSPEFRVAGEFYLMKLFRFRVKLPTLGWIPATAFEATPLKARREIKERFPEAEGLEFVRTVCAYPKAQGSGESRESEPGDSEVAA